MLRIGPYRCYCSSIRCKMHDHRSILFIIDNSIDMMWLNIQFDKILLRIKYLYFDSIEQKNAKSIETLAQQFINYHKKDFSRCIPPLEF